MKTAISVMDDHAVVSPPDDRMRLVLPEAARKPIGDLQTTPSAKILAPIDLSTGGEPAVEYAIDFARAIGAQLTLLHVTDANTPRSEWPAKAFDKVAPGIARLTAGGDLPGTISGVAERLHSDMILMTSEKCSRWTPFWKGSVTNAVLSSTSRPVLIAGFPEEDSRPHCRRILCFLNLDGTDVATVAHAEALARRTGGELILVNAVPETSEGLLYEAVFKASRPLSASLAAKRLREIGKGLSVPYKTWVSTHSPQRCVDLAAREHSPDLVVVPRGTLNIREIGRRARSPILSVAKGGDAPSQPGLNGTALFSSPQTLKH